MLMLQKRLNPRFMLFMFFVIGLALYSILPSHPARGADAEEDYDAYHSTKYASGKWNDLVKKGMEAYHSSDYEVAHKALYQAFNDGCESPLVLFMLAALSELHESYYSAIEFYQMAERGCKKANKEHRYCKTFDENFGRALYNSGKKDEAIPILKKAAKSTKSYWLLKLLGMLSYEKGDTLNALSYLERAVRVSSSDVTKEELVYVYCLLGKLFLSKGEQDGAYRYYQKVLEIDPNNPEAKQFMGMIEKHYRGEQMMQMMDKLKDI